MSSEHKITVGGKEHTIASPSLDKTMRITDYVSEVLEQLPGIFDDAEQFKNDYRAKHKEILTKDEAETPDGALLLAALEIDIAQFDDATSLETDQLSGKTGIAFYKTPSDIETIAAIFPKVWKAARPTVSDLCALLLITDGELEEHDKRGAINGLVKERSHWLRYNASLEELLELIALGLILVKEQVESASSSLGKVSENLTAMLGGAQTEEAPQTETAEETQPVPAENNAEPK